MKDLESLASVLELDLPHRISRFRLGLNRQKRLGIHVPRPQKSVTEVLKPASALSLTSRSIVV